MDIFDLKQSVTEMSDEELQIHIQNIRKERRNNTRVSLSKPKVVKEKVEKPINYNAINNDNLLQMQALFASILEAKKNGE
jgi:hypothetical protein